MFAKISVYRKLTLISLGCNPASRFYACLSIPTGDKMMKAKHARMILAAAALGGMIDGSLLAAGRSTAPANKNYLSLQGGIKAIGLDGSSKSGCSGKDGCSGKNGCSSTKPS
jgi:hypothetical protein